MVSWEVRALPRNNNTFCHLVRAFRNRLGEEFWNIKEEFKKSKDKII